MRVSPDIQLITQQLEQLRRNASAAPDTAKSFQAALTGASESKSLAAKADQQSYPAPQREAPTRSATIANAGSPPRPGSFVDIRV